MGREAFKPSGPSTVSKPSPSGDGGLLDAVAMAALTLLAIPKLYLQNKSTLGRTGLRRWAEIS
jgi:hypothetical protein